MPSRRRCDVRRVCAALEGQYPDRSLGNKRNPLDEYLYITLSLRTHSTGLHRAYRQFKAQFPSWALARQASRKAMEAALRPAGLARQRGDRIMRALAIIEAELGEVSLRELKRMSETEAERFLLRLPGVGLKTARCVMMYSLGFNVLPVDTHVARVSRRLGWIPAVSPGDPHALLAEVVPPSMRFIYHVCCVQHGREVCRGVRPRCSQCCLERFCRRVGVSSGRTS